LSSKKSFVRISSFNSFNQLSCSVSISKPSRSFCSAVSFATQAALSNFTGVGVTVVEALGSVREAPGETVAVVAVGLGA